MRACSKLDDQGKRVEAIIHVICPTKIELCSAIVIKVCRIHFIVAEEKGEDWRY